MARASYIYSLFFNELLLGQYTVKREMLDFVKENGLQGAFYTRNRDGEGNMYGLEWKEIKINE